MSKTTLKLYQGNNLIGVLEDAPFGKMVLREGVTNYPISLFGYGPDKKESVTYFDILKWADDRACPEDRYGIDDILKELELDRYDSVAIATANNYRTIHDDFRMEFEYGAD